jgi:diguanylate cyclase (GGDEF)-like protein
MRQRPALSIGHLALAFIAVLLMLSALLGGFAYLKTRAVAQEFEQHTRASAQSELDTRVQQLLAQVEKKGADLALWDETRQQLVSPEYYAIWRDQRVREAGMLPSTTASVTLYRADGSILNPSASNRKIQARPYSPRIGSRLANEAGQILLHHAFPIYSDEIRQTLLGYGLIKLDLIAELRQKGTFHFADPDSLKLTLQPGESILPAAIAGRLAFAPHPGQDQIEYRHILGRTLLGLFFFLIVAAIASFVLNDRLLVKPLRQLSRHIDAMRLGNAGPDSALLKPMRVEELENVRRSLHEYQNQLQDLHGTLETQNRELHTQVRQDVLTGCFNRRAYEEDWTRLRQDLPAAPRDMAYLLFDCDHFKTINDTYGHAIGDRVLVIIADALVMALRTHDRLYRLGGDEFVALLTQTTPAQAKQVAQRCQTMIEAAGFSGLGIAEPVRVSVGIACCAAENHAHIAALSKRADIAMYSAKQPGHSKIALYDEATDSATETLVASRETSALFQALATPGMIELHYQPIHALPSRKADYYEALARIRWRDELIMPGAFLPVVGSRRLEAEFDLSVLLQVGADLESHQLPAGCGVSINLSAQSLARPEVISQLLELSRYGERHPLMLEITETSLITQMMEVRTYLDLLRTTHFRIAMDDFGTGYSPLRYLVDLPVDVIKFDISLVRKLRENDRAGRVVADFVRMMSDAGYALVAEGVESEAVMARIQQLGFAHVQGYLLGRPQPLALIAATQQQEIHRESGTLAGHTIFHGL